MGFFDGNIQANIEDAIINTFFEADWMWVKNEQLFKLDERNFSTHFKKRIVERINRCLEKNESLSLLAMQISEKCKGYYEDEFLRITAQSALPVFMAKDYHSYLTKKRIERELNVIA